MLQGGNLGRFHLQGMRLRHPIREGMFIAYLAELSQRSGLLKPQHGTNDRRAQRVARALGFVDLCTCPRQHMPTASSPRPGHQNSVGVSCTRRTTCQSADLLLHSGESATQQQLVQAQTDTTVTAMS